VKAVIFDFDGVLVDSERYWPMISKNIFATISHLPWTEEHQRAMVGQSMVNAYEILRRDHGFTMDLPAYVTLVESHAWDVYQTRVATMPGVIACLDRLRARRVPLAIASSNQREFVRSTAARLGLDAYFPVVCSGEDVPKGRAKPYPDLYLLAAEGLGLPASSCVAVEDSPTGIASAKAAGMTCIAYHTEWNGDMDLSAADAHINAFDELDDVRLASLLG
jgi:HAD superfamily hydrolase (TIGR01509 family)